MRTDKERIDMMHARAAQLEKQKRARKVRLMQSAGAVISFAAVILFAVFMPRLPDAGEGTPAGPGGSMHASIFGDSAALGYIVVSVIAFLLGVVLTVFCFRLRKWQEDKDKL